MPKYQASLDRMFHALGDASRRAMVERLARGPASVSELARPFDMSLPTVVQHLGVLEAAGIVTSTKIGRVRTYQLATAALDARRRLDQPSAASRRASTRPPRRPTSPVKPTRRQRHERHHRAQPDPRDLRHRTQLPRARRAPSGTPSPTTTPETSGSAAAPSSTSTRSRTTSASADTASKTGKWHGGPTSRFVSTYTDIVDQQRMVFTYDMWVDDRHISTSLTTIAVEPRATGRA